MRIPSGTNMFNLRLFKSCGNVGYLYWSQFPITFSEVGTSYKTDQVRVGLAHVGFRTSTYPK